jgi:Ca2+-binding RTX toxin-like protein
MAELTAQEQYLLEMINRARLDPAGEAARYGIDLNQGLAAGTISADSKQPLASNQYLATAAQNHSQWMLDTDTFSHTGAGGSSAGDRMRSAGYSFTGSWSWGENISWRGTTGTLNLTTTVAAQHEGLFRSAGHRQNMLTDNFQEIGVGVRAGVYQGYNASMVTENFARSGTGQFLTGVAYFDTNGDKFYSVGEGRGGIRIDARSGTGALTGVTTAAAGGYQVKLASGTYDITLSGNGLAAALGIALTIASENIKLDLMSADTLATNVSATLGANTRGLVLLGIDNANATGNSLANAISGNKGANQINGGGGADTLTGGAGNDVFVIKAGEANGDVIADFTGNGSSAGDSIRFEGYGTGAALTNISGNQWRVSGGGFSETITIAGAVAAGDYSFAGGSSTPPGGAGGTAGADTLAGTAGADTIDGLAGNDSISGLAGDDRLAGGDGADTLIGGDGQDTLNGGTGADSMNGGLGNDLFTVDATTDRVTEGSAQGTDTVQSSIAYTLGAYVENLTLVAGAGSINGTGNTAANTIIGNESGNKLAGSSGNDSLLGGAGGDTLDGGTGNDTMTGGLGDDIFVVAVAGDAVTESAGEGTDTVQSAVVYTLGANLENLTLTGGYAINGTGNGADNLLTGNGAANSLSGGAGADTLRGAAGNDTLNGGTGSDTFWRATGSDGKDTIQDFATGSGGDKLDIGDVLVGYDSGDKATDFVQLAVSGGNTIVRIDANGAAGGFAYADAFVLVGVTGVTVDQLVANGNLILQ